MSAKRALFLDRDGVINYDAGYTYKKNDFKFIDGIFDLCRSATQSGYLLIVVTNQSGIGRGYYSENDFFELNNWMCERFISERAPIKEVFYCPFHSEQGLGAYKRQSYDRKPNPGMLLRASEKHQIDLKNSIMIGDKDSDMQAARSAGVGERCHYLAQEEAGVPSAAATCWIRSLREGIALLNGVDNTRVDA